MRRRNSAAMNGFGMNPTHPARISSFACSAVPEVRVTTGMRRVTSLAFNCWITASPSIGAMRLSQRQALLAARGGEGVMPVAHEQVTRHLADCRVVVDDEDREGHRRGEYGVPDNEGATVIDRRGRTRPREGGHCESFPGRRSLELSISREGD
jgi:hypothetical protein